MIRLLLSLAMAMMLAAPARALDIKEITSSGGIDAWLVETHDIPFTALEIRFKGGTSLDAPGKRGAVNLMAALLEEGAGDLDARAFARERDALATSFGFSARADSLSVSARFLTENRDQAAALLRLALIEPRFDPDAIERVRQQVLASIRSDSKHPNSIASQAFMSAAFGSHPYGQPTDGTEDSVTALTRDDLIAAKSATMARDRIYVSAVGDITAEELGTLLDKLLGDLPATGAPLAPQADYALDGGVSIVDFASPQSVAIFGHEGIKRHDPDFFPAFVLTEVLGGSGYSSRLMNEVREKRGLTYGVYAYLAPRENAAMMLGQVASSNNRVAEAIEVIRAEWERLATEGLTEEELEAVKTYLTGAYPLRFDGNARIAGIMVGMQFQGLGTDYIDTRNDKVNAVTVEDIKRVAKRILLPDELHFVVVGQPEGLVASN